MLPMQIVFVPIVIGQNGGWMSHVRPKYPPKQNPRLPYQPQQAIPCTNARRMLDEARRVMAQRREQQQHEQRA
jgi:hypothetical protein